VKQSELAFLYAYNEWATRRILNAAAKLTEEQFLAPRSLVFGSVRGTLVHAYGAEWIWRRRCQEGTSPSGLPAETLFPTFADLRAAWEEEQAAMGTFVAGLTEEQIDGEMLYTTTEGKSMRAPLWQLLLHVVNHGTQHRAEVAQVLTELGHSPGDVDLIVYVRREQAAAVAGNG
jgi:uncharacterized damage-inducible protein DinB